MSDFITLFVGLGGVSRALTVSVRELFPGASGLVGDGPDSRISWTQMASPGRGVGAEGPLRSPRSKGARLHKRFSLRG